MNGLVKSSSNDGRSLWRVAMFDNFDRGLVRILRPVSDHRMLPQRKVAL